MVPHKTPALLKYIWPNLVWDIPNKENKVYLTFDDGPIPELTEWVLDTLAEFNVKATFFCVGENVKKYPEIFLKTVAAGHSIGNHTFHHLNGREVSTEEYLKDISQGEITLKDHEVNTNLFRPPYGRLKRTQRKGLKGKRVVMWDVLSKDYDQTLDAESILEGTINATKSGSIVVFHDNVKAQKNLKAVLPKYIQYFLNQGYQFDRL